MLTVGAALFGAAETMRYRQLISAIALLAVASRFQAGAHARQPAPSRDVPAFKVDPTWPLELPNKWILGSVTGVFVDAKQHVWITHLPETLTEEETMSPIKVTVPGRTPMERLTNFTKRIIAVPKDEIERENQKWRKGKARKPRHP